MLLAAGVVLAAGPGWLRLELRTDGYALVPRDRPEVQLDSEIRAQFDVRDILIVLLTRDEPGGVYDADTVALIARLTKQLIDRPGIEPQHVTSLATETSHRVRPGTLDFRRFLDPLPTTAGELAQLRADVGRIDLHTGTIVSADGRGAAILVGVPPQCDRTELYADVVRLVNESAQPGVHLDVIGAPVAESLLGLHILEDLGIPPALLGIPSTRDTEAATVGPGDSARPSGATVLARARRVTRTVGLVPLALLAMLLVFAISFRSLPAALLPLMEAGACLAFVFGVMGLAGVPIYLTIAVMPIILTAIGVADEIHIFGRYVQNLRAQPAADRVDVLRTTLDEMHRPVVKDVRHHRRGLPVLHVLAVAGCAGLRAVDRAGDHVLHDVVADGDSRAALLDAGRLVRAPAGGQCSSLAGERAFADRPARDRPRPVGRVDRRRGGPRPVPAGRTANRGAGQLDRRLRAR